MRLSAFAGGGRVARRRKTEDWLRTEAPTCHRPFSSSLTPIPRPLKTQPLVRDVSYLVQRRVPACHFPKSLVPTASSSIPEFKFIAFQEGNYVLSGPARAVTNANPLTRAARASIPISHPYTAPLLAPPPFPLSLYPPSHPSLGYHPRASKPPRRPFLRDNDHHTKMSTSKRPGRQHRHPPRGQAHPHPTGRKTRGRRFYGRAWHEAHFACICRTAPPRAWAGDLRVSGSTRNEPRCGGRRRRVWCRTVHHVDAAHQASLLG
jgi:hypothetical protein